MTTELIEQLNILKPEQIKKASIILSHRTNAQTNDTEQYQKLRKDFLQWLGCEQFFDNESKNVGMKIPLIVYKNPIKTFEMYQGNDDIIKSSNDYNKFHNTRLKLNTETCLEIDKISDINKVFALFTEICNALIRNKIHFYVYYAQGQRSPHIRIYDFLDENLSITPYQREKAQLKFWREMMPFGTFQYADCSMFVDLHPMQLEYAPHWKYGTIFNLMFEYKPIIPDEQKQVWYYAGGTPIKCNVQ